MFEVGSAGGMQGAINHGPVRRQNLAPVGKKLWVIMLPFAVRLQARPDIDVHPVAVLGLVVKRAP